LCLRKEVLHVIVCFFSAAYRSITMLGRLTYIYVYQKALRIDNVLSFFLPFFLSFFFYCTWPSSAAVDSLPIKCIQEVRSQVKLDCFFIHSFIHVYYAIMAAR